MILETTNNLTI